MTWSYSGDPGNSDRDAIRFRITDTTENDPLVTDEEIAYALALRGTVGGASVFLTKQIALRFARLATTVERGRTREEYQDRSKWFDQLATQLAEEAGDSPAATAGINVASTTRAGVEAADSDSGRTRGVFGIGMQDYVPAKDENSLYGS